jgi:hypothetical protein
LTSCFHAWRQSGHVIGSPIDVRSSHQIFMHDLWKPLWHESCRQGVTAGSPLRIRPNRYSDGPSRYLAEDNVVAPRALCCLGIALADLIQADRTQVVARGASILLAEFDARRQVAPV